MNPEPAWKDRKWVHVTLILCVFICTGTSTARIGSFLVEWLGITRFSLAYWLLFVVGLLPIYNVILLPFAWLFGKFRYFRDKQLRTWAFLKRPFQRKS
jgi:hypothetical protein